MVRPCLVLVLLLVGVAAADDVAADLAWRATDRRQYEAAPFKLAAEPPAGVAPLEGLGAPLYGRRPFGERHLLVAVDLTAGAWRLWVDRDFDGDLKDETPVALGPRNNYGSATVALPAGDGDVEVHFFKYTSDTRPRIYLMIFAHREGVVVLEGRLRKLALYDNDGDLRFDGPEDLFFLDVNGDGQLDRGPASFERIVPGRPFRLRDRGHVAGLVGATAGRVLFRRVDPAPPPPARAWRSLPVPPAGVRARPGEAPLRDLRAGYRSARSRRDRKPDWKALREQTTALARIGNLGTREAFQFLHGAYRTAHDPNVRAASVAAMGYRDYVEYADRVARIARRDKDVTLRIAAMESLHRMDAPDRAALYADLMRHATDEKECAVAARCLAWTRTGVAQETLREAVTELPRLGHRYGAYFAATRYREQPPARELVVAAARGVDPRLRNQGLRDAFYLGLPETRLLALEGARAAKTDVTLQMAVTEILASYADPEAIGALLPLAEGATPTLKGRLIDLLRPVRADESVAALLAGLGWHSPAVRALVAEVLTGIPTRRVKEALAARLVNERDEPALSAIIRAAGRLRVISAAPAIVEAARRQRDDFALQQVALGALGRIGLADSVVLEFFTERARSTQWEERLLVLEAAAQSGDLRAADPLLAALADEVWQVRLVVVQGLGRIRVRRAVPALIARLEVEPMKRIKRAIGEALFKLTGQSHYDLADLWKRWWQEYGEGFVLPAEVPERKVRKDGRRTVATFYGVPVESDRVVFVIDHSGSMGSRRPEGGTEFDKAVAETLKVAAQLESGAKLNVILFESVVTRWKKGLVPVTRRNRAALKAYLAKESEGGGTNLYDALEMALLTKEVDAIYLLSDGSPNQGRYTRPEEILRAVRDLNRTRRIAIHCVSLGWDSSFLRDLADQSGGTYTHP